jgi:hypothetical protein
MRMASAFFFDGAKIRGNLIVNTGLTYYGIRIRDAKACEVWGNTVVRQMLYDVPVGGMAISVGDETTSGTHIVKNNAGANYELVGTVTDENNIVVAATTEDYEAAFSGATFAPTTPAAAKTEFTNKANGPLDVDGSGDASVGDAGAVGSGYVAFATTIPGNDGSLDESYEASFTENFVVFDGTNDYLSRASDFDGAADSKTALLFLSVDFAGTAAANEYLLSCDAANNFIRRDSGGQIDVGWEDTAGAANILLGSTDTYGAERCNILIALDADATSRMYVWSESAGAWSAEGTDVAGGGNNLEFTPGLLAFLAFSSGVAKFNGGCARIAMWQGITVPDITSSAVRDTFADASTGVLVDPATSVAAYGTPILDMYGDADFWNTDDDNNNGSGGGLTMNGTVVDAA